MSFLFWFFYYTTYWHICQKSEQKTGHKNNLWKVVRRWYFATYYSTYYSNSFINFSQYWIEQFIWMQERPPQLIIISLMCGWLSINVSIQLLFPFFISVNLHDNVLLGYLVNHYNINLLNYFWLHKTSDSLVKLHCFHITKRQAITSENFL